MKSVQIVQQLESDAVRWQEDKYAQQQQQYLAPQQSKLTANIEKIYFGITHSGWLRLNLLNWKGNSYKNLCKNIISWAGPHAKISGSAPAVCRRNPLPEFGIVRKSATNYLWGSRQHDLRQASLDGKDRSICVMKNIWWKYIGTILNLM